MKHFVCIDGCGRILRAFNAPSRITARALRDSGELVEVTGPAIPGAQFWDGRGLVDMPPRPSDNHDFDYATKAWQLNTRTALLRLRQQRDALLMQTDWRVVRAQEEGVALAAPWRAYRQALRDITNQTDLNNIQWPQTPQEGT